MGGVDNMACRKLTEDDMLNRRIPEDAELIYFRDDFDAGGPVVIAYRKKDVSCEEVEENRRKAQLALRRAVIQIAEQATQDTV